jgi:hypothetical protein
MFEISGLTINGRQQGWTIQSTPAQLARECHAIAQRWRERFAICEEKVKADIPNASANEGQYQGILLIL